MIKKNKSEKTEEEIFDEYLKGQGFRELTEEEKNSPEFKESIENTRRLVKEHKCG